MSFPTEFDWMLVKMGDGASSEQFTLICGLQDATVNQTANTSDRTRRDCAAPGSVPWRAVKTNSQQIDVTGSGLSNALEVPRFMAALGKHKNYHIEGYAADGTDAGDLLGTFAGTFVMTSANLSVALEGEASGEITLASHGPITYTPASGG
jgi:predicted secreted protein